MVLVAVHVAHRHITSLPTTSSLATTEHCQSAEMIPSDCRIQLPLLSCIRIPRIPLMMNPGQADNDRASMAIAHPVGQPG